jgi:hypothetical protein
MPHSPGGAGEERHRHAVPGFLLTGGGAGSAGSRRPGRPPDTRRQLSGQFPDGTDARRQVRRGQQPLDECGADMTPSANEATCAAWAPSRTPRPTATGSEVAARTRATRPAASPLTASRAPVIPISDAA